MSNTERLRAQDAAHLWHPFTQMSLWPGEPPLIITGADGNWLIDSEGKRYLDGVSSLWVTVHGHNHPRITQAITRQLASLDHSTLLGLSHPGAIELAAKLTELTPESLTRVFYSESGSTAVEIALKMAFQYWQQCGRPEKRGFVSLEGAYHGDTLGAVSVGGIDLFHQVYGPLLFPAQRLPQPHCRRCRLGLAHPACDLACAQALEDLLAREGHAICALVVEPRVQGADGMIIQPPGYLKRLEQICRRHEVLLIADEVATGFGRTGAMFACQLEDVNPDLMCLGKGLTGGVLPLSATLTSQRVYEGFLGRFHEFRTFFHGHTYTGNPITCAAAIANLELMESEQTVAKLPPRVEQLRAGLAQMAKSPHVAEVRQQGMMAGIELARRKGLDASGDEPFPAELRLGHQVILACRQQGVIIRPLGDVIVLMPPLAISEAELDLLLRVTAQAIEQVTERFA